jgi:acetyl-CoA acetyltransferase
LSRKIFVAGVGMTDFSKPGVGPAYPELGAQAAWLAMADAGIAYSAVEQVYAGYAFGDTGCGQRAVYGLGLTGIPVINVNNACASGSTALYLARQAIASGEAECVLALGFEQMAKGAIAMAYPDRPSSLDRHLDKLVAAGGRRDGAFLAEIYGLAAREYMSRHGAKPETFAAIAVKSRRHAAANPKALFRQELSLEQVLVSELLSPPLTRLQACPPTCGGAAAVVCSDEFAYRNDLDRVVAIVGQALRTDSKRPFDGDSMIDLIGWDMARDAATAAFEQSGVDPRDVPVVELHDCFTVNELIMYEALGLAEPGEGSRLVADADNTYGGRHVVNPSGGLLSKGHPLGATGLAQCYELVTQLRGEAGRRQVEGAAVAIQHNLGLCGACVVTVYQGMNS